MSWSASSIPTDRAISSTATNWIFTLHPRLCRMPNPSRRRGRSRQAAAAQTWADWRPSVIVAQGHPAIAVSPQQKAEARGDRIQIALREQRIANRRRERRHGQRAVRMCCSAPVIDYQKTRAEYRRRKSASSVATGPGSLHYVSDPTKPDQVFQAAWQTSVQLGRDKGQPVIVMEGRPELAFAAAGSIIGDQIRLYLRELDANAGAVRQSAPAGP